MVTAFGGSNADSDGTAADRRDAARARALAECEEFYAQPELAHVPERRRVAALTHMRATGSYEHTPDELLIGAKLAWRNHARCVGRSHWRTLELIDAREAETAADLAEACWEHLRLATNGGALRSVVTVGPWRPPGERQFRILNSQIIRYAGYRSATGEVIGDPANIALTDLAQKLGWRGEGTEFDVLPLLVQTPDEPVTMFDIPADLVLEVPITHPDHEWFAELNLRWHALPAVANMDLDIGGLVYSCAPFSGWYVNTEVGARNFGDRDRYDVLPAVAARLGLDTGSERTLWRDRALVEVNRAVLHSFRAAGAYMVDHHTVAKQFVDHVDRESRAGRGCPTDWAWVNPPMSASLTPTFHRIFDPSNPGLKPNFYYRDDEL